MPNWCDNNIEVTSPVEDMVCFKQTCLEQCFEDATQSAIFKDEPGYCQFWFRTPCPVPEFYEKWTEMFPRLHFNISSNDALNSAYQSASDQGLL